MIRIIAILIMLLSASTGNSRGLPIGTKAPDFALQDIDGKTFSLANMQGKIVIIAFWRPQQERSIQMLTSLQSSCAEYKEQNVEILAISVAKEGPESIKSIQQLNKLTFPLLNDKEEKIYGDYQVLVAPTVFIVDLEGKISYYYPGYRDDFQKQISGHIQVLQGKKTLEQLEAELHPVQAPELSEAEKKADRYMKAGDRLLEKRMLKSAMLQYQKAIQEQPDLFQAHLHLGDIYLSQEMVSEAETAFTKAVSLNPNSPQANTGLAEALILQNQLDKAAEMLRIALKLNPKLARAHYNLGRIYEKQDNIQDALNEYKTALKLLLEIE